MFIPAAVGLIDSWHSIASAWLQYIVVTVVSTFVVMAVSGWFTQFVIKRGKEAKNDFLVSGFCLFGVLISLAAYAIGLLLKIKTGWSLMNPLLISIIWLFVPC